MPQQFWKALEWLPALSALPAIWHKYLGDNFSNFTNLCLYPSTTPVKYVMCPRECGCNHHVILRHDNTGAVATCHCPDKTCPDILLTIEEITPLVVDWRRLGHAIAKALACSPAMADLQPAHTKQIGSWSSKAIPVILTIQHDEPPFRSAVAQLAASLHKPFILLAPTRVLIDAPSLMYLHDVGAEVFDLQSILAFTPQGTLAPLRPPAELFAELTRATSVPLSHPMGEGLGVRAPLPRYSLTKHLGVWHLIFDGQEAFLRHELGLLYVAWLLYHPDECPIYGIDLMAKVPDLYRQQLGLPTLADPTTGKPVILESHARLQQRNLTLDDAQAARALYKKQKQLEAILDSDDSSEPEKTEAIRELQQLYDWQRHHATTAKDTAYKASRTARQAIARFHQALHRALDDKGAPHSVLRKFAEHLQHHIIAPSGRRHFPGAFTYIPPPGVAWTS